MLFILCYIFIVFGNFFFNVVVEYGFFFLFKLFVKINIKWFIYIVFLYIIIYFVNVSL